MSRNEKFVHGGRDYEIRATTNANGYTVQVFLDGKPASPTYSITFEDAVDFAGAGWGNALENLVSLAKSDIKTGKLEELARALASK